MSVHHQIFEIETLSCRLLGALQPRQAHDQCSCGIPLRKFPRFSEACLEIRSYALVSCEVYGSKLQVTSVILPFVIARNRLHILYASWLSWTLRYIPHQFLSSPASLPIQEAGLHSSSLIPASKHYTIPIDLNMSGDKTVEKHCVIWHLGGFDLRVHIWVKIVFISLKTIRVPHILTYKWWVDQLQRIKLILPHLVQ